MRRSVVLVLFLLLGTPAHAGNRCGAPRLTGPIGLPEAIYVKGACGTFALRRDGTVEPVRPPDWAPRWAGGALARADEQTYISHPRRHLVLLREGRTLWRSTLAHGSDDVSVHGRAIAFTVYQRRPHPDLWIARVGAPERLVARGEDLDGWARAGGFFTQRGPELRLRAADGRLLRRLEFVSTTAYEPGTRTLVAITTSDFVIRTDGRHTVTLADLVELGLADQPWLEVLPSGLIKIGSDNRVLLLRPDGSQFASAALARERANRAGAVIVSSFVTLPRRQGVVFVVQRGLGPKHTRVDRVLLLERGHHVPRVLYEARATAAQCGYWATLSLAGNDVLYWPSPGRALVAIDASGRSAPRDLWPLVHRLPGFRHHGRLHRAAWASAWNG